MGKREIPPAVVTRTELPGGVIEYQYDRGPRYGVATVRVVPAADQSEEAKAYGHRQVQRALRRMWEESTLREEALAALDGGAELAGITSQSAPPTAPLSGEPDGRRVR